MERQWEEKLLRALDVDYSYRLAKRMEEPKSNPVLGYRTAGSRAEFETGELLAREMEAIGLKDVTKDKVKVDAWEFERAVMEFTDGKGVRHAFQLGAYQTRFDTQGPREFQMVYLGRGTAACYRGVDVKGKLVLVDMNQRDEWWINFPVYQAHLKGAAALVAVQDQGYGEIDERALNAQDIAGPADAPAFSISQADAGILKEAMRDGEIRVVFDAKSTVTEDAHTYNITGMIPGRDTERMILLSAHYDSYFSGFQDDNAAVAMVLGIAKALVDTGYQPRYNLVFCALAAEEWGVVNSKYDWSTGAYEQIFTARPEWQGRVIADLNFELPAHAHGRKDGVRCTYEYEDFMKSFIRDIKVDPAAYPEGIEVLCPIQTWSDDFSMAIGGIPSMVNSFAEGSFMETHYHSQFDNEDFYEEPVYRFHHELYGRLVLALDRLALAPLDFGRVFQAVEESGGGALNERAGADGELLLREARRAREMGERLYARIKEINARYGELLGQGRKAEADRLFQACEAVQGKLLHIFRKEQDYFVRLNWNDDVLFPQQAVRENLDSIYHALDSLKAGNVERCLDCLYSIDNNCYAFQFDRQVFDYFTYYVLDQPASRLKWGAGRIVHHENLFGLVARLKALLAERQEKAWVEELDECFEELKKVAESQAACYRDDILYMTEAVRKLEGLMEEGERELKRGI